MAFINPKHGRPQTQTLGGLDIAVAVSPRNRTTSSGMYNRTIFIWKAIVSLVKGMKITLSYLVRPSTVVTQQYPENRDTLKMFDRFRGQLYLIDDDNGYMRCNGCNFCELACPNGSIILKSRRNPATNTSELDRYIWRLDSCTFCNACIQACPHDALGWTPQFEGAVYDRRLLVFQLNRYAGPPSIAIKRAEKKGEGVEELKATAIPRKRYEGNIPLAGSSLPGVPALGSISEEML
jgi:formate hydrogenlyase subunit 6/NADH:ubiquinone oxidoreductase subunit I